MSRAVLLGVMVAAVFSAACQKGAGTADKDAAGASPAAMTEEQKTLYALGVLIGRNITPFNLTAAELDVVKRGMGDAATGKKLEVELEQYGPKVQELARSRQTAGAEAEKTKANEFRAKAAQEPGAQTLPSGLVFRTLTPGTGKSPMAASTVKVHYHGTLTNGTVFDSSVQRGQPAEFPLNGVIPCWTEGVQKMKVGEKARLVCPSEIAYGDQGRPPTIPGGATLVFDVELLEVK
jgi:FKBP-type peptidyl-prolyl cis-trans isomerase FkpA